MILLLQAILEHLKGNASEATVFTTPPCEPDAPDIAKLVSKTKTTVQLKWNAPNHNGGPSIMYILEHDDGKNKGSVETRAKQYTISKLQPSTTYKYVNHLNVCFEKFLFEIFFLDFVLPLKMIMASQPTQKTFIIAH